MALTPAVDKDRNDRAVANLGNGGVVFDVIVVDNDTGAGTVVVPRLKLVVAATGNAEELDSAFEGMNARARSLPVEVDDAPDSIAVVVVVEVVPEDCASINSSICLCGS